jgi:hypothetical protein
MSYVEHIQVRLAREHRALLLPSMLKPWTAGARGSVCSGDEDRHGQWE